MTTATAASVTAKGTMPVAGHLREASRRGIRAAVALLIGVVAGFWLSDQILEVLRSPIEQIAQSQDASLNYDTVTGAFDLKLKIALFTGVIGSSPIWLAELIRSVRSFVDASKARTGLEALDIRQYDPRRIVREALTEPAAAQPADEADLEEQASRVRPGQKYLVTGNSAHPRRILIASLPEDDPRRLAAHVPPPAAEDETELLLAEVEQLLENPVRS